MLAGRRHHDAVGVEQAMLAASRRVVKRRQGREELAQQPDGGRRVEPRATGLGRPQDRREPLARHQLGHQGQLRNAGRRARLSARTLANAGWLNVASASMRARTAASNPGIVATGGAESEELEGGAGVVEQAQAIAENVGETFRVPSDESGRSCERRIGG